MNRWVHPLLAALERTPGEVAWFFRDDDAGWDDQRLLAVADVFQRRGVVLDVAAIPAAVSPKLSEALRAMVAAGAISVHQHGWAHVNHETQGRRSEFGAARATTDQRRDLQNGQSVLAELLEGAIEPIFTPPWNRCEDRTVALLVEGGLTVLSCDASAPRRNVPGVAEVPVRVDWARCWREGGPQRLGEELAQAIHEGCASISGAGRGGAGDGVQRSGEVAPILGVMLHHATMTEEQLDVLAGLAGILSTHPSVVLAPMAALGARIRDDSRQALQPIGPTIEMESP
ncbi:MAG: polysaccharide deacetylase family protein [Acidimicrobiales bacterium]